MWWSQRRGREWQRWSEAEEDNSWKGVIWTSILSGFGMSLVTSILASCLSVNLAKAGVGVTQDSAGTRALLKAVQSRGDRLDASERRYISIRMGLGTMMIPEARVPAPDTAPLSRKELTRCPHQLCTCLFDRDWLPPLRVLLIPFPGSCGRWLRTHHLATLRRGVRGYMTYHDAFTSHNTFYFWYIMWSDMDRTSETLFSPCSHVQCPHLLPLAPFAGSPANSHFLDITRNSNPVTSSLFVGPRAATHQYVYR